MGAMTLGFRGLKVEPDGGKTWCVPIISHFLRRLALPPSVKHWTLTTLRDKLVKIGSNVVHHARYVTFHLAEVAVPGRLYPAILDRIRRFAAISPRAAPI